MNNNTEVLLDVNLKPEINEDFDNSEDILPKKRVSEYQTNFYDDCSSLIFGYAAEYYDYNAYLLPDISVNEKPTLFLTDNANSLFSIDAKNNDREEYLNTDSQTKANAQSHTELSNIAITSNFPIVKETWTWNFYGIEITENYEFIRGGNGDDHIEVDYDTGKVGGSEISEFPEVYGGDGNDTIEFNSIQVTRENNNYLLLDGGNGNDVIKSNENGTVFCGGVGDDTFYGYGEHNWYELDKYGNGNDVIQEYTNNDCIRFVNWDRDASECREQLGLEGTWIWLAKMELALRKTGDDLVIISGEQQTQIHDWYQRVAHGGAIDTIIFGIDSYRLSDYAPTQDNIINKLTKLYAFE